MQLSTDESNPSIHRPNHAVADNQILDSQTIWKLDHLNNLQIQKIIIILQRLVDVQIPPPTEYFISQ